MLMQQSTAWALDAQFVNKNNELERDWIVVFDSMATFS